MSSNSLREVKSQLEKADFSYNLCLKDFKREQILQMTSDQKEMLLHFVCTTIEQYLKGLLLWKGKNWGDLKKLGHKLQCLYESLDEEGKENFKKLFVNRPHFVSSSYTDKSEIQSKQFLYGAMLKGKNATLSNTINITLENGRYDGFESPSMNLFEGDFEEQYLKNLFEKLDVPALRYSNSSQKVEDNDLLMFIDVARNLRKLANIARGYKSADNKQNILIRR